MTLSDQQKVDVLLAALAERYEAQRTIRERVQTIGIAAIGLLLGAGGWLIQSERSFELVEKGIAIAGLLAAVAVLRFAYLANLQQGFRNQQKVAARIEATLDLFTPGVFDTSAEPIYPDEWAHAGTNDGPGAFFKTTYLLLCVGVIFLVATIVFVT